MRALSRVLLVVILCLPFLFAGCACADAKEKVTLEVAVHDGYIRHIDSEAGVTKTQLERMVKASAKAWRALDVILNDAEEE